MTDTPEALFRAYLESLGLSAEDDPEIAETPERFTALLRDRLIPTPLPAVEPLPTNADSDSLIIVRDVAFHALCVHHLVPFFGRVAIGYLPDRHIMGFGAVHRVVEAAARGPQLQERLVESVANHLTDALAPTGLVVACQARQMCMELTGTPAGAQTVVISARGSLSGERGQRLGRELLA